MHALVAEAERVGDLAQRSAGQLKAAHRPVKLGPRHLRLVVGVDDACLGGLRLVKQAFVKGHVVYCT